ncbi:hypothetical protein PtA15_2A54 [Puccinia triticina]|uniref:Tet-like 2OG-Fe(II) oxygenase domain-containing protein n=1 Tax=Puccinia triticina TaxID=208348 RepID=A0ABY7C997_9BASI|nr:uncharacterized protein PtA15_2A54 [Puccinia triticina]WAQ81743.1 hypothetical protein PtA15_2A54 [Puccinia triticina]
MEDNKRVPPKNFMKSRARKKRRLNNRKSPVSNQITSSHFKGEKIIWSLQDYIPRHIYPEIHAENKSPWRKPTHEELARAQSIVDSFVPFTHGKVILIDKTHAKVVAVIKFIPISELSAKEKRDINRVTTFLHKSKKFVNRIAPGRVWGGGMWGVGWRKCMKALELFGRYIKLRVAHTWRGEYLKLAVQGLSVSRILGQMFKSLGDIPFESNRKLMEEHGILSLASGEFNDRLSEFDCSPHITFTTNGFYNRPHRDTGDASEFAFALFVPTKSSDGTLADAETESNASGGRFVFPDYKCYIEFQPQTVVKLLWAAKSCEHCTLPGFEPKGFTRMGMSLQITQTALNICSAIKTGIIYLRKTYRYKKNLYFGGHQNYMGKRST